MVHNTFSRADAERILSRFDTLRVLVVGDLMLDEHIWGSVSRVSPEAPVLVLDAERDTYAPGGAANVAHQLQALGASVVVAGVVGNDDCGVRLRTILADGGADVSPVVSVSDRPTTQKTRIVAGNQQLVRVDREKRAALAEPDAARLIAHAESALQNCDALVLSDYDKGVLRQNTIERLVALAHKLGKVVTVNPKPLSARFYAGADVVQMNRLEADQTAQTHLFESPDEQGFHDAGTRLRDVLQVRNLLVTRGAQGLTVFRQAGDYLDIPAHRVDVFDPAGAGDSTISGVTLALAAGAELADALRIGNAAGGVVVRKAGVVTATREEIAALFV